MEPTVSIIVPVYNAETTLRRCIDSVLGQSFEDFELLLVDDGSRDGSPGICDDYAGRDSRVKVFHQPNGGVSSARNFALDHAGGTYLQFLDSDDWLTQDATGLMVRAAQKHQCDLVISDFYRVVGERVSHKGDIQEDAVLSREEFAAQMMDRPADFYYGVLWNKLYRRDLVERHHLRMNPEISWCEDFMFNLEYIRWANSFYALQIPVYYYVKTKGSLVAQSATISKTIRMKLEVFAYYNRFFKTVLDEEEYEHSRLKVYRFLIDSAADGVVLPSILSGSKRLGDERVNVPAQAMEGEGVLLDTYRERKLLETCLEPVALQYDLAFSDLRLLLCLNGASWTGTKKELAEILDLSMTALNISIQKLASRSLLMSEEVRPRQKRNPKTSRFFCTQQAAPVLEELTVACGEFQRIRTAGLSDKEAEQYAALTGKIRAHVLRFLQAGAKPSEKSAEISPRPFP